MVRMRPPPVPCLAGTVSGACVDGAHFPWPRPLAPPTPQRIAPPCSPASQLLWPRPTSHARASSATALRLPDADRRTRERTLNRRPDVGSPKFRRDPFARDVLFDPGRVDSTSHNGTAHVAFGSKGQPPPPAKRVFRGSITHPTQPLCTLRVRHCCRLTQHSLPGGLLGLTWAGLAPADRASFAWRLPSLDHLVSAISSTLPTQSRKTYDFASGKSGGW
jgi:hypothetical protein